ncbi:MAG: hypothetical protein HYU36_19320 [Planctomycetes bacterium]|nr:hypothetical protein [Planctomycetota bacterium]
MKLSVATNFDVQLIERIQDYFVRADWLHRYESLGYETFKLTERNAPTEIMARRVKAYVERRYDGNLLDLVQPFSYPTALKESTWTKLRRLLWLGRYLYRPWKARWSHLKDIKALSEKRGMLHPFQGDPPVVIDNRALDGFLDAFPAQGCRDRDCDECGHCRRWADRCVRIDPQYRQECLELYQRVFHGLLSLR